MIRNLKLLVSMLAIILSTSMVHAQWRFVADKLTADSTRVFLREVNTGKDKSTRPYKIPGTAFYVPNGDTLFVAKADSGVVAVNFKIHDEPDFKEKWWMDNNGYELFVTVTINGKKYFVESDDLVLVDGNEEKWWESKKNTHHTTMGHWFSTPTPHWLVVLFVFLAFICAILGGRTGSAVITWLTIPFLACAIALEALGIYYLGDELLWWMDQKVYGFGPAAGGALLLAATAALQFLSMTLMAGGRESGISYIWPLVAIVGAGIIAAILVMIGGSTKGSADPWVNTAFWIFAVAVVLSIILTFVINMRSLSIIGGIFFSLFVLIWTAGVLAMVALIFIGLFTYFLDTLLMVIGLSLALGATKMFPDAIRTLSDGTVVHVFYR